MGGAAPGGGSGNGLLDEPGVPALGGGEAADGRQGGEAGGVERCCDEPEPVLSRDGEWRMAVSPVLRELLPGPDVKGGLDDNSPSLGGLRLSLLEGLGLAWRSESDGIPFSENFVVEGSEASW